MTLPLGMLEVASTPEAPFWRWWRATINSIAIGLVAAVVGAGLVWIAYGFGAAGPMVLVAIPAVPFITLAIALDNRIGLMLVFATFPVSTFMSSVGFLPLQPVELAVLYVAVVVAATRIARGSAPISGHPALIGAAGLLTWTLVALTSAPDRSLALNQTFSLLAGILFAMLVIAVCSEMRDLKVVLGALVAVAGASALWALATGGPPEAAYGGATVTDRLSGPFNQPNQLGSFCAAMSVVSFGLALAASSLRARLLSAGAGAVLLAALILSLSRGAWIGAVAGLLLFAISSPRVRVLVIAPLLLMFLGLLFFVGGSDNVQVQVVGARLESFTDRGPYDSRPEIWAEAVRQLEADPVTGQGPGNFPVASTRSGSRASNVYPDHAHNLFLNWGAEGGLPSVVLILVFVFGLGMAARRARQTAISESRLSDASLVAGFAGALASVLVHGMLDYPLRNQVLWMTLWAIIGLLLAATRSTQRS